MNPALKIRLSIGVSYKCYTYAFLRSLMGLGFIFRKFLRSNPLLRSLPLLFSRTGLKNIQNLRSYERLPPLSRRALISIVSPWKNLLQSIYR
jgi:hypothetical protein